MEHDQKHKLDSETRDSFIGVLFARARAHWSRRD